MQSQCSDAAEFYIIELGEGFSNYGMTIVLITFDAAILTSETDIM